jgi:diacylglycerol kinase (ATP)
MTIGVLINPRSGRKTGKGEKLLALLRGRARFPVAVLDDFTDLPKTLRDFADAGVDTLVLSCGDGTIHAVQTELAERSPFASMPALMLLPHGTANMTASDLGMKSLSPSALADLLLEDRVETLPRRRRPTLRVLNPGDGQVRHGMFVGAGAVYTGTRFCQETLHATGLKSDLAIAATLAVCIGGAVLRRPRRANDDPIARPYQMRMFSEGREKASGGYLLTLATTLDKLVLGMRPFWGGKTGPIRATALPYPVANLLRWIWPALYGAEDRNMPPGAVSFCVRDLEIWSSTPFVIDGEFFDPPRSGPLKIETGPTFEYICG